MTTTDLRHPNYRNSHRTRLDSQPYMPDLPDGWQQIACPLCGGLDHAALCDSKDWILDSATCFHVVRCRSCELAFVNPRPGPQLIGQYYPASYAPYHRRKPGLKTAGLKWLLLRRLYGAPSLQPTGLARHFADLCIEIRGQSSLPFGVAWHGEGRLLDFGCGGGEFLRRMSHLGWKATGVDFSLEAVEQVRALGLEAFQGSFPNDQLLNRQFDVITMRMSLEHVHDPLQTVQFATSILAPQGRLAIIVPNFDSCYRQRLGEEWYPLDLPRHLTHFQPHTLRRLLEKAGLQTLAVSSNYDDGVFRKSMALCKKRHHPTGLDGALSRIKPLRKLLGHLRTRRLRGDDLVILAQRP